MRVDLLQYSPISLAVIGARVCYDSFKNSDSRLVGSCYNLSDFPDVYWDHCEWTSVEVIGRKDRELIRRLIGLGHESVLEHVVYTFFISGISRGCLQQLVRHRIASYSVQSTRYTLKKILKSINSIEDVDKYFVFSPNIDIDLQRREAYERVKLLKELSGECKNDDLKYLVPENLKTELVMTMNCRELRHFLRLRLDRKAHWEIRKLAREIYNTLPHEHREILFFDIDVPEEE